MSKFIPLLKFYNLVIHREKSKMSHSKEAVNLLSYHLFVHASSGSVASMVAVISVFPFLTLIQRKQRKLKINPLRTMNFEHKCFYIFLK